MASVILLCVRLGVRGSVSPIVCPLHSPMLGVQPRSHSPAFPSILSPTSLWVSLELGDAASGAGLDGLSDTELDRGSPPFS